MDIPSRLGFLCKSGWHSTFHALRDSARLATRALVDRRPWGQIPRRGPADDGLGCANGHDRASDHLGAVDSAARVCARHARVAPRDPLVALAGAPNWPRRAPTVGLLGATPSGLPGVCRLAPAAADLHHQPAAPVDDPAGVPA